ncbi:MAG: DUF934 domain-containing protein [Cellvibrionaceae bacterium]
MPNLRSRSDVSVLEVLASEQGRWSTDQLVNINAVNSNDVDQTQYEDAAGLALVFELQQWLNRTPALVDGFERRALRLHGDENLEELGQELKVFALIIIEFSHFTDGRGFSLAAQLRERYGYQGELRASGYLLADQLNYLRRCGFDSFTFSNDVNREDALQQLMGFSVVYQPSTST